MAEADLWWAPRRRDFFYDVQASVDGNPGSNGGVTSASSSPTSSPPPSGRGKNDRDDRDVGMTVRTEEEESSCGTLQPPPEDAAKVAAIAADTVVAAGAAGQALPLPMQQKQARQNRDLKPPPDRLKEVADLTSHYPTTINLFAQNTWVWDSSVMTVPCSEEEPSASANMSKLALLEANTCSSTTAICATTETEIETTPPVPTVILQAQDPSHVLPIGAFHSILCHLSHSDLATCASVCMRWRDLIYNARTVWRALCLRIGGGRYVRLPSTTAATETADLSLCCGEAAGDAGSRGSATAYRFALKHILALRHVWYTGKYKVTQLKGHTRPVSALQGDGERIVSGSSDGTVRMWDRKTLECVAVFERPGTQVNCLALHANLVVVGCEDGLAPCYHVTAGGIIFTLRGHRSAITCVAAGSEIIATGSRDHTVRLWARSNGDILRAFAEHTAEILAIRVHGRRALSASWDDTLRLWHADRSACTWNMTGHTESVFCMELDANVAVSGGGDGVVRAWDLTHRVDLAVCDEDCGGHARDEEVYCLAWNQEIVASGAADSVVCLWSRTSWHLLARLDGHVGVVRSICIDGWKLVSGGDKRKVLVWDWAKHHLVANLHRHPQFVHLLWCDETGVITASPEKGRVVVIEFPQVENACVVSC
eukprot:UC1_evm3s321